VSHNVYVTYSASCPDCAERGRRATHMRITFKSNDRFGGFQVVIEQPEGIRTARGDQNSQRGSDCAERGKSI
jgi:hypothetical protein